jgi:hypothetical protein
MRCAVCFDDIRPKRFEIRFLSWKADETRRVHLNETSFVEPGADEFDDFSACAQVVEIHTMKKKNPPCGGIFLDHERKETHEPRTLDRVRELALVPGTDA